MLERALNEHYVRCVRASTRVSPRRSVRAEIVNSAATEFGQLALLWGKGSLMPGETVTCPDCDSVLTCGDTPPEEAYDVEGWRRLCKHLDLGGPSWCLVCRNGSEPQIGSCGEEHDESRGASDTSSNGEDA
jgi:hypothetical protein